MNRSTTVECARLNARIERLKREEQDLRERVGNRASTLESEGRWVKSDPLHQSLFFALAGVRRDLWIAEKQLLRRGSTPSSNLAVTSAVKGEYIEDARLLGPT